MKTAIYIRVSTGKQAIKGMGLQTQLLACRSFITSHRDPSLGLVKVYKDTTSGRREHRPGLDRMLHDAALHRFKAIVVFKFDRLSRREVMVTGDVVDIIKKLQSYGVQVFSTAEEWWDPKNPVAPIILMALSWAASMESKSISIRVTSAIDRKKKEAKAAHAPFVWGAGHYALARTRPELPGQVAALRSEGQTWVAVSKALGISVSSAKRLVRGSPPPGFPRDGRVGLLAKPKTDPADPGGDGP